MSSSRLLVQLKCALRYGFAIGFCPLCERRTVFVRHGNWNREQYKCTHCDSIPRWRAIYHLLQERFPGWRELVIHESFPSGNASQAVAQQCRYYSASHYYENRPLGAEVNGYQNQNLEQLTFQDNSIDVFLTQDVLEHILHPERALVEIARVLKPGGAHLFTIPWKPWQKTEPRVVVRNGELLHLKAPEYHGNPISEEGSLVMTDWGSDIVDIIKTTAGMDTEAVTLQLPRLGIKGESLEVFISVKSEVP